jgi:hypothetical protein
MTTWTSHQSRENGALKWLLTNRPIRPVTLDDIAKLEAGAVAVLARNEQTTLSRLHPELHLAEGPDLGSQRRLYRIVKVSP